MHCTCYTISRGEHRVCVPCSLRMWESWLAWMTAPGEVRPLGLRRQLLQAEIDQSTVDNVYERAAA